MPDHTDSGGFPAHPGSTARKAARPDESGRRGASFAVATRPAPRQTGAPRPPTTEDRAISTSVSEVLDYFEKCPSCGYPAQATVTVRRFPDGRVETAVHPTCGLPCGWHGTVEVMTKPAIRHDSPPPVPRVESATRRGVPESAVRDHSARHPRRGLGARPRKDLARRAIARAVPDATG